MSPRIAATGAAGCSIEDFARRSDEPIYEIAAAAARVEAAAEAAHRGDARLVLTARAENFLHGRADLADTIARLQAYQAAGADVVYAPGVHTADDIRTLVSSVDVPVNVLALPLVPPVAELGRVGCPPDLGRRRVQPGRARRRPSTRRRSSWNAGPMDSGPGPDRPTRLRDAFA